MASQYDIDINFNLNGTEDIDTVATKLEDMKSLSEDAGTSVEDLGNKSQESSDDVKDLGDSSESSSEQVNLLGDAVSAVASLGLAAEFNNTAMAADKYNVSMAALNQVAGNNNISMNKVSDSINKVTSATSISGGQARNYFSMLMNLGVTNTNALAESMINLKGQSAITGGSIEQMSSKLTTIVNGTSLSARSLTQLGISMKQLADTNGMSVEEMKASWSTFTADQKINALNKAMAQNSDLVTTMNQTTSEQLQEVKNSWAGLEITVGQSSTVASQAVLGLTNGAIQGLNYAVQNIPFADVFASGALAVGSLATGVKPAIDTFNSLSLSVRNGLDLLTGLGSGIGTVSKMIRAMSAAESISAGIKAAWAIATGTETAAEAASVPVKAADTAATAALTAVSFPLWAVILLIAVAITALIAGLLYLYNTNATVRNGVNALIAVFRVIASLVSGAVTAAFNAVKNAINQVKSALSPLTSALNTVQGAWNGVKSAVSGAVDTLNQYINKAKQAANTKTPSMGISFEGFNGGTLESTLNETLNTHNKQSSQTPPTEINNNFYGIIEEDAAEWVIKSVNDRLRKENLIRGV